MTRKGIGVSFLGRDLAEVWWVLRRPNEGLESLCAHLCLQEEWHLKAVRK